MSYMKFSYTNPFWRGMNESVGSEKHLKIKNMYSYIVTWVFIFPVLANISCINCPWLSSDLLLNSQMKCIHFICAMVQFTGGILEVGVVVFMRCIDRYWRVWKEKVQVLMLSSAFFLLLLFYFWCHYIIILNTQML
jgi:hypothetical protein